MALDHLVPGLGDHARRKRFQIVGWRLVLGAAVLLLGLLGTLLFDHFSTGSRVKDEKDAEETLDKGERPFTAASAYDDSEPPYWKMVLDRPLTAGEQAKLTTFRIHDGKDAAEAWTYLRSLGGRPLRYPSVLVKEPLGGYDSVGADATVFHMNLFSNRQSNLSIVDMRPSDVACRAPSARTVVEFPPAGGASYEGVLFDLSKRDVGPVVMDEGKTQGQPYFSQRKIDLGNGESPGALTVEALAHGKTCEWKIRTTYQDAYQNSRVVTVQNGDKPFVAEAAPADPEQLWVADPTGTDGTRWVECHKVPDWPGCVAWREGQR